MPPHAAPLVEPTLTTDGVALDHVPPVGVQLSTSQLAGHKGALPVMALGAAVTVTTRLVEHPVAVAVYVINSVPKVWPVTIPPAVVVA